MYVVVVAYFFVMLFGLGSLVTLFFKNWNADFVERQIVRLMLGIPAFVFLSTIMSLAGFIGFRMHWTVFLAIAFLGIASLWFQKQKFVWDKECWIGLAAIVLCCISVFVMVKGSFAYTWLEDSDPWNHAMGAKYVAVTGMGLEQERGLNFLKYIDAYPPGYDVLLGMLHQLDANLNWLVKFFNALLVSLSILFGYVAFKRFLKSAWWGLLATFFLLMIPGFLSHFIWVHTLAPIMFFAILYCFEMNFLFGSILSVAGLGLVQLDQFVRMGSFFVGYGVIAWFWMKEHRATIWKGLLIGTFLALVVWWIPMFVNYGSLENLVKVGLSQAENPLIMQKISTINFIGSATRPYSFNDFFIATAQNTINNPVGVGMVLFGLVLLGGFLTLLLVRRWKEHPEYAVSLLWFVTGLFLVMGWVVQIVPFRAWMLMVIPCVLLATIATKVVWNHVGIIKYAFLVAIIIGVVFTSGVQKYELNTSVWSYGWLTAFDAKEYDYFFGLPANTKVFVASVPKRAIAYNLMVDAWDPDFNRMYDTLTVSHDVAPASEWLLQHQYSYVVIDATFFKDNGGDVTNQVINDFLRTGQWNTVYNHDMYVLQRRY